MDYKTGDTAYFGDIPVMVNWVREGNPIVSSLRFIDGEASIEVAQEELHCLDFSQRLRRIEAALCLTDPKFDG